MTEKEIAIGLYREGLKRSQIRRKLEITGAVLAEYLQDEPERPRKPRECKKPIHRKHSPARVRGEALLRRKLPVSVVQSILEREGLPAARSTICRWHLNIFGRINKRVPIADYPVLEQLVKSHPGVRGLALSKLYHDATGNRLDRRAAGHWCRKLRAAA